MLLDLCFIIMVRTIIIEINKLKFDLLSFLLGKLRNIRRNLTGMTYYSDIVRQIRIVLSVKYPNYKI